MREKCVADVDGRLTMGGAIFIVIIGVPIGLFMLLRPKKLWWATESWKFKNPDANEPSDTAYGMTAFGGLVLIIGSIFCAAMFWSADNDYKDVLADQQAEKDRRQAIEDYVPPPAVNRGALPVIGYTVEDLGNGRQRYEVYFLQPRDAFSGDVKSFGSAKKGWFNCVTRVGLNRQASPPAFNGHLSWEPTGPPKPGESDKCAVGDLTQRSEIESDTVYLDAPGEIVTDSAIVDPRGAVVLPAKPGNVIPRLDAMPVR